MEKILLFCPLKLIYFDLGVLGIWDPQINYQDTHYGGILII